jgi:hypothetical protein
VEEIEIEVEADEEETAAAQEEEEEEQEISPEDLEVEELSTPEPAEDRKEDL